MNKKVISAKKSSPIVKEAALLNDMYLSVFQDTAKLYISFHKLQDIRNKIDTSRSKSYREQKLLMKAAVVNKAINELLLKAGANISRLRESAGYISGDKKEINRVLENLKQTFLIIGRQTNINSRITDSIDKLSAVLNYIVKEQKAIMEDKNGNQTQISRIKEPEPGEKTYYRLFQKFYIKKGSIFYFGERRHSSFDLFRKLQRSTNDAIKSELKEELFNMAFLKHRIKFLKHHIVQGSYKNTAYGKTLKKMQAITARSPLTLKQILSVEFFMVHELLKLGFSDRAKKILVNAENFIDLRLVEAKRIQMTLDEKRVKQLNDISKRNASQMSDWAWDIVEFFQKLNRAGRITAYEELLKDIISVTAKIGMSHWAKEPEYRLFIFCAAQINSYCSEMLKKLEEVDDGAFYDLLDKLEQKNNEYVVYLVNKSNDNEILAEFVARHNKLVQEKIKSCVPLQRARKAAFKELFTQFEKEFNLKRFEGDPLYFFALFFATIFIPINKNKKSREYHPLFLAAQDLMEIIKVQEFNFLSRNVVLQPETKKIIADFVSAGKNKFNNLSSDQKAELLNSLAVDYPLALFIRQLKLMIRLESFDAR
ncbi:MAG: hypothetical protein PHV30_09325 [Candidatus Margulisbacteria bacterium]|nr:hypothetical protein [Candidatus Margulisiibacteriota bacterium]